MNLIWLRPAGGDPEIDRQQKYFFDGLCFFEWPWPFWTPLKAFREEAVWFKQRKTRREVAPFLTPLGGPLSGLAKNRHVGKPKLRLKRIETAGRYATVSFVTLPISSDLHFNSPSSLACFSSACTSLGMLLWKRSSRQPYKFCSISDPPSPFSLSFSACDQIWEKESLPLNTTIRTSKRKFDKCGHQVQVSRAPTASM